MYTDPSGADVVYKIKGISISPDNKCPKSYQMSSTPSTPITSVTNKLSVSTTNWDEIMVDTKQEGMYQIYIVLILGVPPLQFPKFWSDQVKFTVGCGIWT